MTAEAQPKHASLVEALAAAQADFPAIEKDKQAAIPGRGPYHYADIAGVLSAVRPVLARHGLAVVQRMFVAEGGGMMLRTELLWGEQSLASDFPIIANPADPQKVGSAMTYYRRYALCALVGVAADEDDDGEAAKDGADRKPPPARAQAQPRQQPKPPAQDVTAATAGTATPPEDDRGEPAYKLEGVPLRAVEWIDSADKESRRREGRALMHWWDAYKDTRHAIYQRHADMRPMLKALSDEIRERALRGADALKVG